MVCTHNLIDSVGVAVLFSSLSSSQLPVFSAPYGSRLSMVLSGFMRISSFSILTTIGGGVGDFGFIVISVAQLTSGLSSPESDSISISTSLSESCFSLICKIKLTMRLSARNYCSF